MPDLMAMQAATPKCPRLVHRVGKDARRCGHAMGYMGRYSSTANRWRCSKCQQMLRGEEIARWCAELEEAA